jgi:hypothetical protein
VATRRRRPGAAADKGSAATSVTTKATSKREYRRRQRSQPREETQSATQLAAHFVRAASHRDRMAASPSPSRRHRLTSRSAPSTRGHVVPKDRLPPSRGSATTFSSERQCETSGSGSGLAYVPRCGTVNASPVSRRWATA